MRTLEAFIAILLTIIFLIIVFPKNPAALQNDVDFNMLTTLAQDDNFRGCIIEKNNSCVNTYIKENIDFGYYNYTFNISSDSSNFARINKNNVFLKTYFFVGNETIYSPRILKLYYWKE